MLTICWMASSCPTIIRRSPVSNCVASLPVFPGSSGILSRTILSTAFRLGGAACLSSPLHKLSGNPSAISIDAPDQIRILPHFLSLSPCRTHFHAANQRPRWYLQQHLYYFGNVFGPDLPICTIPWVPTEFRGHASRHDVTDPHVLAPQILHHRFRETRQTKLGSVISSSAGECMRTCQTT